VVESTRFRVNEKQRDYQIQMKSQHSIFLWVTESIKEKIHTISDGLVIQLFKEGHFKECLGYTIIPIEDFIALSENTKENTAKSSHIYYIYRNQSKGVG